MVRPLLTAGVCSPPALNARSARVLFLLVAPGHLIFLYTISSLRGGHATLTPIFISFYLAAALLQVLWQDAAVFQYVAEYLRRQICAFRRPTCCFRLIQVMILLYMADWMVHWMWGRGMDPDNFSIPYLTALGDLLGTGFLALCFHMRWFIGDRDAVPGN